MTVPRGREWGARRACSMQMTIGPRILGTCGGVGARGPASPTGHTQRPPPLPPARRLRHPRSVKTDINTPSACVYLSMKCSAFGTL